MNETLPFLVFSIVILVMMALDLGVFHRRIHSVSLREATFWSITWIALSMAFNVGLFFWGNLSDPPVGSKVALEFFTGYILEKALSVDNIFVFVLIFSYFRVPSEYQHKILFWGVIGALLMRAIFIALGVTLIKNFHWVFYIFGGFLVYTGIKMAQHEETDVDPESNFFVRLCRKIFPITPKYIGSKFFVFQDKKIWATPLFLVLVMVETTDLVFALDSIPAIFAVTQDPFVVYTSNVFAILGLRSLYFVLIGIIDKFRFLKLGLAAVLSFVGLKMLVADFYKLPVHYSLLVIVGMLGISIVASLIIKSKPLVPATDFSRQEANGRWRALFRINKNKKKKIGS
jgi:tellurite resistance protein TerC